MFLIYLYHSKTNNKLCSHYELFVLWENITIQTKMKKVSRVNIGKDVRWGTVLILFLRKSVDN